MVLGHSTHRRPALNGGTGSAPISRAMPLMPLMPSMASIASRNQPILKTLRAPQQLSLDLQPRLR
ncbi:MAG: hypothetical protein ABIR94_06530 [Rubrivivax sp.]